MIALAYDNSLFEGQLLYSGGCMVSEGKDLETSILISLLTDARAQPGDNLPDGVNKRGWWADAFDEDGESLGSMLWLLEDALATDENAQRAVAYAQDALAWMISEGHVRAIDIVSEVHRDAVWLGIKLTLPNGDPQTLSPFKAF